VAIAAPRGEFNDLLLIPDAAGNMEAARSKSKRCRYFWLAAIAAICEQSGRPTAQSAERSKTFSPARQLIFLRPFRSPGSNPLPAFQLCPISVTATLRQIGYLFVGKETCQLHWDLQPFGAVTSP